MYAYSPINSSMMLPLPSKLRLSLKKFAFVQVCVCVCMFTCVRAQAHMCSWLEITGFFFF